MKKNVVSKILAGTLASAMVFSMAACGGNETESSTSNSSSTPISSTTAGSSSTAESSSTATAEPTADPGPDMSPLSITISIPTGSADAHTGDNPWYDKLVTDLNEYLQMDITWEWLETNTYYETLALNYMSGDVADVVIVSKDASFLQAAEEGLFWDLTPYIDDYDNLSTIPEATRANASHNGKMYGVPRSRTLARNGLGYRLDWLNNLGLKEPTTWDAYVDMLYAFTYNDPDGNGVDDTVGLFLDSWAGAWDIMMTWFGVPNTWGIDENGDLIHKSQTPEYKTALAAFRQLYADGLINNGANGIPDFQEVKAGGANKEGMRTGLGGSGVQVLDDQRKIQTYFEDQGITTEDNIIYTLQGAVDTGLGTLCYPTTGMNNMVAISTKTVKTEDQLKRVLQMLNDINDGDCITLIEDGWEGITYSVDENGYIYDFTTEEKVAAGMASEYVNYADSFMQIIPYFTAEQNAKSVTKAPATSPIRVLENKLYTENIQYCVTNYGASYSSDTYVEQGKALDTILSDAQLMYIIGEIDDAGLDEQLKTWWTAGGEQVTKEMNDLYHAAGN